MYELLQYDRNENSRQIRKAEILENLKRLHANVVSKCGCDYMLCNRTWESEGASKSYVWVIEVPLYGELRVNAVLFFFAVWEID